MARKNPLDRIAAKAADSIKDPRGTADKVYAQAKGASAVARHLAGAFGQFAMAKATETAGTLAERAAARRAGRGRPGLRPVPDVNEPAAPVPPERFEQATPAAPADQTGHGEAAAKKAAEPAPSGPAKPGPTDAAGPVAEPAPTRPAEETPDSPAASAAPATPADVARAVKKNGGAPATADTGPGDKLPPPRKAQTGDQTAQRPGAKSTGSAAEQPGSTAEQGTGTSATGKKAASKKAASKKAASKKATGKKAASKKATGKKATGGSTAKKQPPPSSDG